MFKHSGTIPSVQQTISHPPDFCLDIDRSAFQIVFSLQIRRVATYTAADESTRARFVIYRPQLAFCTNLPLSISFYLINPSVTSPTTNTRRYLAARATKRRYISTVTHWPSPPLRVRPDTCRHRNTDPRAIGQACRGLRFLTRRNSEMMCGWMELLRGVIASDTQLWPLPACITITVHRPDGGQLRRNKVV